MLFLQNLFLSSMLLIDATAMALILPRQNLMPNAVSGDTFIHDPTVVKTQNGYIAAYTGDNVQLKTSTDRKNWRNAGAVFPNGAPWTTLYTQGARNLWAPDISFHDGKYYMYYSASSFGSTVSAIFLATSTTGLSGQWTNQGVVIESNARSDFNAIDANLIVDASGEWWLTLGSFWSGIKLVKLDPKTGKRSDNIIKSIASRQTNSRAIEAPFIFRRGDFYYLWVSFDSCCKGAASTYRIMVGRSKTVQGPYLDKSGKDMMQGGGTEMMATHGAIHGPGHNAVFADTDGDVLVYHYYMDNGAAQIGINFLRYDNDWPTIVSTPAGQTSSASTTVVKTTTVSTKASSSTTLSTKAPLTTAVSTKTVPSMTTLSTATPARTTTAVVSKTTSAASGGAGAPLYGQCGGQNWTGPTTCAVGTCKSSSPWYSQCLN